MKWWKEAPEYHNDIVDSVKHYYPDLNVSYDEDQILVTGVWHVYGKEKHVVDYEIEIIIDRNYPESVPTVFEVGGDIKRCADNHINGDGSCCLEVPPRRHEVWPIGASFKLFLDVMVHNHFYFQACKKLGIQQKEWSHETEGIFEYYGEKLDVKPSDKKKIIDLLEFSLKWSTYKAGKKCPCGSKKWYSTCHHQQLSEMEKVIPRIERKRNLALLKLSA